MLIEELEEFEQELERTELHALVLVFKQEAGIKDAVRPIETHVNADLIRCQESFRVTTQHDIKAQRLLLFS